MLFLCERTRPAPEQPAWWAAALLSAGCRAERLSWTWQRWFSDLASDTRQFLSLLWVCSTAFLFSSQTCPRALSSAGFSAKGGLGAAPASVSGLLHVYSARIHSGVWRTHWEWLCLMVLKVLKFITFFFKKMKNLKTPLRVSRGLQAGLCCLTAGWPRHYFPIALKSSIANLFIRFESFPFRPAHAALFPDAGMHLMDQWLVWNDVGTSVLRRLSVIRT